MGSTSEDSGAAADPVDGGAALSRRTIPLGGRVMLGVLLGVAFGVAFGTEPFLLRYGNEDLGALGLLVIRLLKTLATPLILLAVLDSFLTTQIGARVFGRFVAICFTNISVSMLIGLTILNVFQPGLHWRGHIDEMTGQVMGPAKTTAEWVCWCCRRIKV